MATEKTPTIPQTETDTNGADKPKLGRAGTMQVTAEEGKEFLEGQSLEKTRGATATLQDAIKQSETDNDKDTDANGSDKPSLARATTIQATTEAAKDILGDEVREKTRKQTREERVSASSSQENDKTPLQRTTTMSQTAQEGAALLGEENFGKTRSQTQKAQTPTKAPKRTAPTPAEGEDVPKKSKTDSSSDEQTADKPPIPAEI
ncbi:High mobility group nucleosome-binding domain-containing protein 5-like [Oopsacas minuta]|uniref:High mobility group nucleosome-binding domain-containing protein 5-like n=1 Tax=Oopsacas minuta TaxID=111878 RepID=A0AAV7JYY2_9METZ|nr:High mobility group nucleosome-binding domain-containing protein 5-like [Oopsacas minuta]